MIQIYKPTKRKWEISLFKRNFSPELTWETM